MRIDERRTLRVISLLILITVIVLLKAYQQNSMIGNVSAVESIGIGIYWDNRCTNAVTVVDWGTLSPGSQKSIPVYVRNENTTVVRFIFVKTAYWNPPAAASSMQMSFNYADQPLSLNQVGPAAFILRVSSQIFGIQYFTFNIIVYASQYFAGDINHDGHVDPTDFALFGRAFGSTPLDATWNPNADFDESGKVDAYDFTLLSRNYGK